MTDKRDSDKPGHNLAGILLMVAAVTTFAMLDATAKYTVKSLSTAMVVCFRYGIASAYVAILDGAWAAHAFWLLATAGCTRCAACCCSEQPDSTFSR